MQQVNTVRETRGPQKGVTLDQTNIITLLNCFLNSVIIIIQVRRRHSSFHNKEFFIVETLDSNIWDSDKGNKTCRTKKNNNLNTQNKHRIMMLNTNSIEGIWYRMHLDKERESDFVPHRLRNSPKILKYLSDSYPYK